MPASILIKLHAIISINPTILISNVGFIDIIAVVTAVMMNNHDK